MWLWFKDSKIDVWSKQKTNGTLCIVCACVFFIFNKLMLKHWRCHCVCVKGMGFSNVSLPQRSPIARRLYSFACFFFPRMSKWPQLNKTALGKQTLFTVMRSETSLFTQLSADLSAGSGSIVTCRASQQALCFLVRLSSAPLTAQVVTCFLCFPFVCVNLKLATVLELYVHLEAWPVLACEWWWPGELWARCCNHPVVSHSPQWGNLQ